MPSPLISIKKYIQAHPADEVKKQIPQWLQQLKQQHISSMALQALLCHFSQTEEKQVTTDTIGFIRPESIKSVDEKKLIIGPRNQVSNLESELGKAKKKILKFNNQRKLAWALAIVELLILIALCVFR